MATIRRLPAVEHNFQLVITKVYEEGDQDLLEDEDESRCSDLLQLSLLCSNNKVPVQPTRRKSF